MKKFIWCFSHVTIGALKTFLQVKAKTSKTIKFQHLNCPISVYSQEGSFYQVIPHTIILLLTKKESRFHKGRILFYLLILRWHNKTIVDQNKQIFSMQIRAPFFSKLSIPSMLFLLVQIK